MTSPVDSKDGYIEDLLLSDESEPHLTLHQACRLGDLEAIAQAYDHLPSDINTKDDNVSSKQLGWTPLYRAVVCGHLKATEFLLRHGADPNSLNNLSESPLHHACDNSLYPLASLLLSFGASVNAQQSDGDTPLHLAAFRGDERMVEILLAAGAVCDIQNYLFGQTPLHYAADCGSLTCVKLLLMKQADPLVMDKVKHT